ncbi:MAG: helix-turn-helix transcriptional regulator [Bacteroidales bacterium]|nr:helix-turn-helix transcriptional regulator [Bacteroidales bacterium]
MGINEIFGNNVRKIRTEKKFSQEELASMAGIDRTYMSDIENGRRNVSLVIAEKVAKALDVELKSLL